MPTGIYNHKETKTPIYTEDRNKKISLAKKGVKFSEASRKKMSNSHLGVGLGESNHTWRGDKVGYRALHHWIKRHKGEPKKCEKCGIETKKKYEWANTDHRYRRILDDYIRLCTSCHRKYDYEQNRSTK